MTCLDPHSIDALGELPMNGLQKRVQAVWAGRHHDQMNVIRHEAVSDDLDALSFRMIAQEIEVPGAITSAMEHLLPVVSSLSDVVGYTRKHEARVSRHRTR